jgi:hypothetical protein
MKPRIFLVLILIVILFPVISAGGQRTVNIIYTGSMNGELEPCGCSPETDFGGVARLSGYLNEHSRELSPYVLIDAGNFTPEDTPQGRLKAEAMLKSFGMMRYDAVAIQEQEKIFPAGFLSPLLKKYKVSSLSDMRGYSRSVAIKRKGVKLNISIDPDGYKKDRLNVLLTGRPVSEYRNIKGWDVIISSSGEMIEGPSMFGGAVIASGYPKGKKLGVLTLQIDGKGRLQGFTHRWEHMGSDITEDIKVRDILNEYDSSVARMLNKYKRPPSGVSYLGVAVCAECHQLFEESWKKTRHAMAFSSLEKAGKSADPECLVCHAVGSGEKGGFYSIKTTPGLANVQCEECHGLDREHVEDFSRPMKPVTVSVCLKCHTEDRDPNFDYPVYYEKIRH